MTLVSGVLEATRRRLRLPESLNELNGSLTTGATSVALDRTLGTITAGSVLSVGLEEMYVWEVDQTAKTATVRRGHGGSTATTHADGALVRVAQYSDFAMLEEINNEVRALSGQGIFQMKTLELTSSVTSARTYNLAADVTDVYDVLYDDDSFGNTWPRVASWTWRPSQETDDFASGSMLRLDSPVPSGRPLRVLYKAGLSGTLDALNDDVETVTGLRASAHDILALGAAWRLSAGEEIARNQTFRQGDSRRAEEVPPGAKTRAPIGLQQVRAQRIAEELRNQARLYPSRSH